MRERPMIEAEVWGGRGKQATQDCLASSASNPSGTYF
jgi:hypothetical protein